MKEVFDKECYHMLLRDASILNNQNVRQFHTERILLNIMVHIFKTYYPTT